MLAHKASFFVWFAATTVHVLRHLGEAFSQSWREMRRVSASRRWRATVLLLAVAGGIAAVALLLPHASAWTNRIDHGSHRRH